MIASQAIPVEFGGLVLIPQISQYQLDTDTSEASASVLQNYKISVGLTSPRVHFNYFSVKC